MQSPESYVPMAPLAERELSPQVKTFFKTSATVDEGRPDDWQSYVKKDLPAPKSCNQCTQRYVVAHPLTTHTKSTPNLRIVSPTGTRGSTRQLSTRSTSKGSWRTGNRGRRPRSPTSLGRCRSPQATLNSVFLRFVDFYLIAF